ncbi:MAG: hypothetical protein ACFNUP_07585, partial [Leptotrichia hofstadii]
MKNILVIGGGSWGTCLSKLLVENGHKVYLWEHNEEVRKVIRDTKENPQFLPNIKLPDNLNVVDDYGEVLENSEKYGKIDILLLAMIGNKLKPNGTLVFSQEHPITTCHKEG